MNRIEGLITFVLLVAIFVAAAGCSQQNAGNSTLPDTGGILENGIDSPADQNPTGNTVYNPEEGLAFDLIAADSWIDPGVLPESEHYFSYDNDNLGEGTIVTYETDSGYFIDEWGEKTQSIATVPGDMVLWEAPEADGPSEVKVRASGPEGFETETMNIEVDPEPVHARTSQPYHTSLFLNSDSGSRVEVAAGELLVGFRDQGNLCQSSSVMESTGLSPLALVDSTEKIYRVRINSERDLDDVRSELESNPDVEYVEYNYINHLAYTTPNDPGWSNKWDLGRMNALNAWDLTTGSNSVIVAVIDTGVDRDHPDLAARIVAGADFVSGGDGLGGEMSGDGMDNNYNGWVDENVGHGTHCAGIIGAIGNNGIGTVGVNLSVKIMPLRVFPVDGDGGASVSAIASAINYAVANGAKVVSLSLGSPYYSTTMHTAITNADRAGVIVTCAAGNSNTESVYYPAGYPDSIAVASINKYDSRSYFSNYGSWVDVCAPGESIYSTYFNNSYALMSGTSMACPQVAGLAALVWAYKPFFSATDIREAIEDGADPSVYNSNPSYAGKLGTGCIDMFGALEACIPPGNQFGNNPDGPQNAMDESGNNMITIGV